MKWAAGTPTLPKVVDALFNPSLAADGATIRELMVDGRDVGHALRRLVSGDLAGLFDGESTVTFDPSLPMISLDLSGISGSDQLIAMVMACASAWMESALCDPEGGPRWVIYNEAWRLLRQPALLARMQSQWKLSRGLGIANLMIIHRLSDLSVPNATSCPIFNAEKDSGEWGSAPSSFATWSQTVSCNCSTPTPACSRGFTNSEGTTGGNSRVVGR